MFIEGKEIGAGARREELRGGVAKVDEAGLICKRLRHLLGLWTSTSNL